jgi:hypothetical protein
MLSKIYAEAQVKKRINPLRLFYLISETGANGRVVSLTAAVAAGEVS